MLVQLIKLWSSARLKFRFIKMKTMCNVANSNRFPQIFLLDWAFSQIERAKRHLLVILGNKVRNCSKNIPNVCVPRLHTLMSLENKFSNCHCLLAIKFFKCSVHFKILCSYENTKTNKNITIQYFLLYRVLHTFVKSLKNHWRFI